MTAVRQVALVTGATGAIGKAIAQKLAETPGYEVVMVGRDARRGEQAAEELRRLTASPAVRFELVDLASLESIRALAERFAGPLHVLINNAAECPRRRLETPEGVERQFATNVLGYHRMIRELTPALQRSAPSRVVNVASYWAGGLDLTDLEFRRRPYDNDAAYRQSKQADRMLSAAFARRLEPLGVAVNSCHPGDVRSKLSTDLGFGGHESPAQGAQTPAWLATDPIGQRTTGGYFEHLRESRCPFSADEAATRALFERCDAYG